MFFLGEKTVIFDDLLREGNNVDFGEVWLDAILIETRDIEKTLEEFTETLRGIVSESGEFAGAIVDGRGFGVQDDAKVAFDDGDRGAHLMAGDADKIILDAFTL